MEIKAGQKESDWLLGCGNQSKKQITHLTFFRFFLTMRKKGAAYRKV